jgi:hypothetical protein
MKDDFYDVLGNLAILPSKPSFKGKFLNDKSIEAQILKLHNASTYIPKVEQGPTILDLPKENKSNSH